ncbi:MAG: hypothetical protein J6M05_06765, partial [Cardiobacteriaceae bacterium]|nr:hypothetical protein [Cardiobacteriaceae bacterium]
GNTLAEGLWAVGESSYGLYKSDDKIDYFYDGTVENLNAISAKISDKIEDIKANAAACGDDYICKGAIYGKPATDTASYVIGGVGTAKTLGTVEKTVQKSADNLAGEVGKTAGKVENTILNELPDPYVGVKEASQYLQELNIPKEYRSQIINSFNIETIHLDTANTQSYGIRFYDNTKAYPSGSYLFETFTNQTNRANLALPYEWNGMDNFAQWQINE